MIHSELLADELYTQGFHIIDEFLDLENCQKLREQAQMMHNENKFRSAKIGINVNVHENEFIRTDKIAWLDETNNLLSVQHYLNEVKQIAEVVNRSLFLGLSEYEAHFAAYEPGSCYKKHVDQFATQKTRKISCVYYLNKDWQSEYGGELMLYNREDQLLQRVLPHENRFICFNSELPHEVVVTCQPRYSITGWLKTRSMALVF